MHILNLPLSSMPAPIPSVLEKQDVSVEMDLRPRRWCRVLNLLVNGIEAMHSIAWDDMVLTAPHLVCHLRCVYL